MEPLLVSACLLGRRCKYDGGHNALGEESLAALRARYELLPVCPEADGGLPTPRVPAERVGERVLTQTGQDVTEAYRRGAQLALETARAHGCRLALLKSRSPSCGAGVIYDGTFTHTRIPGDGVAAGLLRSAGLRLYTEQELSALLDGDMPPRSE